jgi:TrmH family RNA methyltransferase
VALINSIGNPKVKRVRALLARRRVRQSARQFVVEGVRLLEEALQAGVPLVQLFYTAEVESSSRGAALLAAAKVVSGEVHQVSRAVMNAMSDTETPQGVIAVLPWPELPPPDRAGLLLILDGLRDPGNLGAILRSAAAAGVAYVCLAPGTVDPYNPKVVRSAMGAHFRLPVAADVPWREIRELCAGRNVYLADPSGETRYFDVDWTAPCALIVGGEAKGAGQEIRSLARKRISIPLQRGVESLNAATAAAIILFEAVRQRTQVQKDCRVASRFSPIRGTSLTGGW